MPVFPGYYDSRRIRFNFVIPNFPNVKINIGDIWKLVDYIAVNIGDEWKLVSKLDINVGDDWKSIK